MEFFNFVLVYLILAPVVIGWFVISFAPLLIPIISLTLLIVHIREKNASTSELNANDLILVVDDDYDSVTPLLKILERARIPFKYVSDGFGAISELHRKKFRLVIMDLCMPNLTGVETLFRADMLMTNDSAPTPVIFYTDFEVADEVKNTLKHLDVVDCWSKSMNLLKLYSRINRFMIFNAS